jgi:hypothetical protein
MSGSGHLGAAALVIFRERETDSLDAFIGFLQPLSQLVEGIQSCHRAANRPDQTPKKNWTKEYNWMNQRWQMGSYGGTGLMIRRSVSSHNWRDMSVASSSIAGPGS